MFVVQPPKLLLSEELIGFLCPDKQNQDHAQADTTNGKLLGQQSQSYLLCLVKPSPFFAWEIQA